MKNDTRTPRSTWGSQIAFILAAAGSAIGLGNVWKFPYITGQNGGSAFILVYLLCVTVVGLPILIAEFVIGRQAQRSQVGAFRSFSDHGVGHWWLVGMLGVVTAFFILAFYSVVAGWTLAYVWKSATGQLGRLSNPQMVADGFSAFTGSTWWPLLTHAIFMALTIWVVSSGVRQGIERCNDIMMPAMVMILLVLVARSVTLDGARAGIDFLIKPSFAKLSWDSVLLALGHAFFTLSVGMGVMVTYASYLPRTTSIIRPALAIVLADTGVALLAGLAIFPAVFATGGEPAAGPGLVFVTLPTVFNHMPFGQGFAFLFFAFLVMAALTSTISLLEAPVAYLIDERGWSRRPACLVIGGIIFILGIPCSLSFGLMAGATVAGRSCFDWFDYLSSNFCLPIGGLLLCLFVGYRLRQYAAGMFLIGNSYARAAQVWVFLIRYVAPVLVVIILVAKLFGK